MSKQNKKLKLSFHGRIIDHLGIQMYQSPVAAIAELISNAWDADAEEVKITLPEKGSDDAKIIIEDDGIGMTFEECQNKYLKVGWCRRGDNPMETSPEKKRPILGRKGIGKFAGFGIAEVIIVETISKATGEKTIFKLNLNDIRGNNGGDYVSADNIDIETKTEDPNEKQKENHGTKIILQSLKNRRPSIDQFSKSMARRFLLHQMVDDFKIIVNNQAIPQSGDLANVQFSFPRDYTEEEKPSGINIDDDGWGEETLSNGKKIRWKINFYKKPIDEEELRGVSIFSHGKMTQKPFLFNLTGGMGGQHGQEYVSGQIRADYLDEMDVDIIATERQRVNWEHEASRPLLEWGQDRIKKLFKIWQKDRAEAKNKLLEKKMAVFSARLEKLAPNEKKNVKGIIKSLASIPTLSNEQFNDYGNNILTLWEGGRLSAVLKELAESEQVSKEVFSGILLETDVLSTLNMGEGVRAKLDVIIELNEKVSKEEYENDLRDFLAEHAWLMGPDWEFFIKESGINNILKTAAENAKLDELEGFKGRVDLVLTNKKSGPRKFHIVELMRPGKKADMDHLKRFEDYVTYVKTGLEANTLIDSDADVTGFLVADQIEKTDRSFLTRQKEIKSRGLSVKDWEVLLNEAVVQWNEFLEALIESAPDDPRIKALAKRLGKDK